MCGLALDSGVIMILCMIFNEGDGPGWLRAILCAIGISIGFWGCAALLGEWLGLLSFAPMVLVAAVILCFACELQPKQGLIAGAILLAYKVAMSLIFQWATS